MDKINAEVFLSIMKTGSFRKTAEELGYTQAGISYIVNAMEEEIGLQLFIRERSGVQLSAEGKQLIPHMKALKIWERQFEQTVKEMKGLERGTVRVQIFDSISIHWIPDIIRRFKDDYPRINIELITEEDSVKQEKMVQRGEVDCGFFLTKVHAKIDTFPLLKENLLAIMSTDHPLASGEKFPIRKLGDYPYVGMKYDGNTGILDIFKKKGIAPKRVFKMDNDYAAMAMVSKGLGFSIFPELLVRDAPYEIRTMEFDEPQTRVISIGTANRKTCSKACLKFIEYTRNWVEEWKREQSIGLPEN